MKRILPAAVIALAIHGLLFTIDVRHNPTVRAPKLPKVVQLSLASVSPVEVAPTPPKPRVLKKDPKPRPVVNKTVPKKLKRKKPSIKKPPKRHVPPKRPIKKPKKPLPVAKPAPAPQTVPESTPEDRPPERSAIQHTAPKVETPRQKIEHKSTSQARAPNSNPDASVASEASVASVKSTGQDKTPTPLEIRKAFPAYRKNPPPRYPLIARRRGYEGVVLMEVLVDRKGQVKEVKIVESSGHRALDRAALKSVEKWTFVPGKKGNQTIDMWVSVPIRFALQ